MPSDDRKKKALETRSPSESTRQTQSSSETKPSKETLPKVTLDDLIQFSEGSQIRDEDSNDKE